MDRVVSALVLGVMLAWAGVMAYALSQSPGAAMAAALLVVLIEWWND